MSKSLVIPEIAGTTGELEVRRWTEPDAQALNTAVAESREHLRPWMPFASEPPLSLRARQEQLAKWTSEWAGGGDCYYAILVREQVAGSAGLHRRLGPGGLEIGYWLHPDFTGQGVVTRAVVLMTGAALSMPDIERVEIYHDRANTRSGAVPRRVGFRLVSEEPREPEAPGETGIEWRWQITRDEWAARLSAPG